MADGLVTSWSAEIDDVYDIEWGWEAPTRYALLPRACFSSWAGRILTVVWPRLLRDVIKML